MSFVTSVTFPTVPFVTVAVYVVPLVPSVATTTPPLHDTSIPLAVSPVLPSIGVLSTKYSVCQTANNS